MNKIFFAEYSVAEYLVIYYYHYYYHKQKLLSLLLLNNQYYHTIIRLTIEKGQNKTIQH